MKKLLWLLGCGAWALSGAAKADAPASRPATRPAVEIHIDTTDAPELKAYGDQVEEAAKRWYPVVAGLLKSPGYDAPTKVNIVFRQDYKGVAATGGSTVVCSAPWFLRHPEDVGAIMHELVHVVQHYPRYDPVWLVEGIADYERFWVYEPQRNRIRLNPDTIKYTDGYQHAAMFLAWAQNHYDKNLVAELNAACRENRYRDDTFRELTGKPLDVLFDEFRETLKAQTRKAS